MKIVVFCPDAIGTPTSDARRCRQIQRNLGRDVRNVSSTLFRDAISAQKSPTRGVKLDGLTGDPGQLDVALHLPLVAAEGPRHDLLVTRRLDAEPGLGRLLD